MDWENVFRAAIREQYYHHQQQQQHPGKTMRLGNPLLHIAFNMHVAS